MQKISFYLVPNRITVTTDMVNNGYSTEKRQVYQRNIRLYKGIDNTFELDVRQSDDRRLSVVGNVAVIKFYDAARQNLFSVTATPILSKTGIMTVTIPKTTLEKIDPQLLTMAAFLRDSNDNETILYADAQFGIGPTVELLNGYNDAPALIDVVKTWNYDMGSKDLISEIVDFKNKINDDYASSPISSSNVVVTTNATNPYRGNITVEATDDKSLALGNRWTVIGTINSTEFVSGKRFSGEWRFLRFRYPKWVDANTQKEITGIIDKIVINN